MSKSELSRGGESAAGQEPQVIGNLSPAVLVAVSLMFFLSGASGLIYEVVWTRQLVTFFGSTLFGVATVLASFMGGLALGSFLIGKRADSMRHPLAAYGMFEIGIAAAALAFPFILKATQPVFQGLYVTGGERTFYVFSLVRFVVVFLLLMVPTTLMGATLPVLSKAVTSDLRAVGRRVGALYALNTTGAVLGVFLTGFLLLESFGIFRTTIIAAALNICVGISAILLGKRHLILAPEAVQDAVEDRQSVEVEPLPPGTAKLVLLTYMLSGFIALAYQICWTRALIFSFDTLKSTTYSFSGMLVVFLLGLAIGSWLMQLIVDKQQNLLRLYALIQAGIGLSGGLSFFLIIRDWPTLEEIAPDGALLYWSAVGNVMIKTAIAIGLPTFLMGMAFPVVSKIVVGSLRHISAEVSKVYALNTVGAIFGSFLCGFVLIPTLGISGTLATLAALNLGLAGLLFYANPRMVARQRLTYSAVALAVAVLIPVRIMTSTNRFQRLQDNEKMVHYEEGALATVSVIENNSGDRMIYVDDVGVAGTDKIMLTDQKSLAHVPMMLLGGHADNVLSVGFGSGGASWSYTLYEEIKNIYTIEIAPEVLRAASKLTDSNHGVIAPDSLIEAARASGARDIQGFRHPLSDYVHSPLPGFKTFDPRWHVLVDDARSYLRFGKVKFDVIATDCTDLRYKSNANLYDLEYFTLCREAITDRGMVVVWMPLAGLSDRAFRSALRTFQVVFPEMSVWYFTNQPTHYCLLIGTKGRMQIDYPAVQRATALPLISNDLEEIGLRDTDKLISSFVCDERSLAELLKPYPLNTEDHPIIEFEAPRYGYDSRPLYENQIALYNVQVPAGELLKNVPNGQDPASRIWKLQQANMVCFEGHAAYRLYDYRKAAELYQKALDMVPFDDSIRRLLDFDELRRHYETARLNPVLRNRLNTFISGFALADVYLLQKRYMEAATFAEETIGMLPEGIDRSHEGKRVAFDLYDVLIRIYAESGRSERAAQFLPQLAKYARDAAEVEAVRTKAGLPAGK